VLAGNTLTYTRPNDYTAVGTDIAFGASYLLGVSAARARPMGNAACFICLLSLCVCPYRHMHNTQSSNGTPCSYPTYLMPKLLQRSCRPSLCGPVLRQRCRCLADQTLCAPIMLPGVQPCRGLLR
jgi:hypothetical protein